MLISIVTGTYNRLDYLQRMITSARRQIPRHVGGYEFVIVDGGSTDGTLAWLERQPDVHLIRHAGLLGAIRAFCDGARATQGDYVVLANDDIEFLEGSLLRAVAHLESHRSCGAIAFADNRLAQIRPDVTGHHVTSMPATGTDGQPTHVPYAQVGMVRRWLGQQAGWWGDQDAIMRHARTYGGDNYLSARIWELGYSVDAVPGCTVDDLIPRDQLRQHNASAGQQDSAQYYARYPRGPVVRPTPSLPNPQRERLRVLLLDIHEPRLPAREAKEYGLADALSRVGLTWEIDFVNEPYELGAAVACWQPHVLITQMHDTSRIHARALRAARQARPDVVIVNWNGDAHEKGLLSPDILEALRYVDLQTVVNAAVLPVYEREGIRAAYWQIGYKDPAAPYPGEAPSHEVLFLGNCYNDERHALVDALRASGADVAIYGSCPGAIGNTHYDFALSRALYERCSIAVSDTYPGTVGFVSNRLFQALAAGAFVLQQHSPQLDALTGLRAGEHYVEWRSLADLQQLVRAWLKPDRTEERRRIAECGRALVREHFSYDAQVRKLWTLLP